MQQLQVPKVPADVAAAQTLENSNEHGPRRIPRPKSDAAVLLTSRVFPSSFGTGNSWSEYSGRTHGASEKSWTSRQRPASALPTVGSHAQGSASVERTQNSISGLSSVQQQASEREMTVHRLRRSASAYWRRHAGLVYSVAAPFPKWLDPLFCIASIYEKSGLPLPAAIAGNNGQNIQAFLRDGRPFASEFDNVTQIQSAKNSSLIFHQIRMMLLDFEAEQSLYLGFHDGSRRGLSLLESQPIELICGEDSDELKIRRIYGKHGRIIQFSQSLGTAIRAKPPGVSLGTPHPFIVRATALQDAANCKSTLQRFFETTKTLSSGISVGQAVRRQKAELAQVITLLLHDVNITGSQDGQEAVEIATSRLANLIPESDPYSPRILKYMEYVLQRVTRLQSIAMLCGTSGTDKYVETQSIRHKPNSDLCHAVRISLLLSLLDSHNLLSPSDELARILHEVSTLSVVQSAADDAGSMAWHSNLIDDTTLKGAFDDMDFPFGTDESDGGINSILEQVQLSEDQQAQNTLLSAVEPENTGRTDQASLSFKNYKKRMNIRAEVMKQRKMTAIMQMRQDSAPSSLGQVLGDKLSVNPKLLHGLVGDSNLLPCVQPMPISSVQMGKAVFSYAEDQLGQSFENPRSDLFLKFQFAIHGSSFFFIILPSIYEGRCQVSAPVTLSGCHQPSFYDKMGLPGTVNFPIPCECEDQCQLRGIQRHEPSYGCAPEFSEGSATWQYQSIHGCNCLKLNAARCSEEPPLAKYPIMPVIHSSIFANHPGPGCITLHEIILCSTSPGLVAHHGTRVQLIRCRLEGGNALKQRMFQTFGRPLPSERLNSEQDLHTGRETLHGGIIAVAQSDSCLNLVDCAIQGCSDAVIAAPGSIITATKCSFLGAHCGLGGMPGSMVIVNNCEFHHCQIGISAFIGCCASIRNCSFDNCSVGVSTGSSLPHSLSQNTHNSHMSDEASKSFSGICSSLTSSAPSMDFASLAIKLRIRAWSDYHNAMHGLSVFGFNTTPHFHVLRNGRRRLPSSPEEMVSVWDSKTCSCQHSCHISSKSICSNTGELLDQKGTPLVSRILHVEKDISSRGEKDSNTIHNKNSSEKPSDTARSEEKTFTCGWNIPSEDGGAWGGVLPASGHNQWKFLQLIPVMSLSRMQFRAVNTLSASFNAGIQETWQKFTDCSSLGGTKVSHCRFTGCKFGVMHVQTKAISFVTKASLESYKPCDQTASLEKNANHSVSPVLPFQESWQGSIRTKMQEILESDDETRSRLLDIAHEALTNLRSTGREEIAAAELEQNSNTNDKVGWSDSWITYGTKVAESLNYAGEQSSVLCRSVDLTDLAQHHLRAKYLHNSVALDHVESAFGDCKLLAVTEDAAVASSSNQNFQDVTPTPVLICRKSNSLHLTHGMEVANCVFEGCLGGGVVTTRSRALLKELPGICCCFDPSNQFKKTSANSEAQPQPIPKHGKYIFRPTPAFDSKENSINTAGTSVAGLSLCTLQSTAIISTCHFQDCSSSVSCSSGSLAEVADCEIRGRGQGFVSEGFGSALKISHCHSKFEYEGSASVARSGGSLLLFKSSFLLKSLSNARGVVCLSGGRSYVSDCTFKGSGFHDQSSQDRRASNRLNIGDGAALSTVWLETLIQQDRAAFDKQLLESQNAKENVFQSSGGIRIGVSSLSTPLSDKISTELRQGGQVGLSVSTGILSEGAGSMCCLTRCSIRALGGGVSMHNDGGAIVHRNNIKGCKSFAISLTSDRPFKSSDLQDPTLSSGSYHRSEHRDAIQQFRTFLCCHSVRFLVSNFRADQEAVQVPTQNVSDSLRWYIAIIDGVKAVNSARLGGRGCWFRGSGAGRACMVSDCSFSGLTIGLDSELGCCGEVSNCSFVRCHDIGILLGHESVCIVRNCSVKESVTGCGSVLHGGLGMLRSVSIHKCSVGICTLAGGRVKVSGCKIQDCKFGVFTTGENRHAIQGSTIEGGQVGVRASGIGSGTKITWCLIHKLQANAVLIENQGNVLLHRCIIKDLKDNGVNCSRHGRGSLSSCVITDVSGHGIVCLSGGAPVISKSKIKSVLKSGIMVSSKGNPRIQHCSISDCQEHGVYSSNHSATSLYNCRISFCHESGCCVDSFSQLMLDTVLFHRVFGAGVKVMSGRVAASNTSFISSQQCAVFIGASGYCMLNNCMINECLADGIIAQCTAQSMVKNSVIKGCRVAGVRACNGGVLGIRDCALRNNTVSCKSEARSVLDLADSELAGPCEFLVSAEESSTVSAQSCLFFGPNSGVGLSNRDSFTTVTSSIICGCDTGISVVDTPEQIGNLEIRDCNVTSCGVGINILSGSASISNCTVNGCTHQCIKIQSEKQTEVEGVFMSCFALSWPFIPGVHWKSSEGRLDESSAASHPPAHNLLQTPATLLQDLGFHDDDESMNLVIQSKISGAESIGSIFQSFFRQELETPVDLMIIGSLSRLDNTDTIGVDVPNEQSAEKLFRPSLATVCDGLCTSGSKTRTTVRRVLARQLRTGFFASNFSRPMLSDCFAYFCTATGYELSGSSCCTVASSKAIDCVSSGMVLGMCLPGTVVQNFQSSGSSVTGIMISSGCDAQLLDVVVTESHGSGVVIVGEAHNLKYENLSISHCAMDGVVVSSNEGYARLQNLKIAHCAGAAFRARSGGRMNIEDCEAIQCSAGIINENATCDVNRVNISHMELAGILNGPGGSLRCSNSHVVDSGYGVILVGYNSEMENCVIESAKLCGISMWGSQCSALASGLEIRGSPTVLMQCIQGAQSTIRNVKYHPQAQVNWAADNQGAANSSAIQPPSALLVTSGWSVLRISNSDLRIKRELQNSDIPSEGETPSPFLGLCSLSGSQLICHSVQLSGCRGDGLFVGSNAMLEARHVVVKNCGAHGLSCSGTARIQQCVFSRCFGAGIACFEGANADISSSKVVHNFASSVFLDSASSASLKDCKLTYPLIKGEDMAKSATIVHEEANFESLSCRVVPSKHALLNEDDETEEVTSHSNRRSLINRLLTKRKPDFSLVRRLNMELWDGIKGAIHAVRQMLDETEEEDQSNLEDPPYQRTRSSFQASSELEEFAVSRLDPESVLQALLSEASQNDIDALKTQ